MALNSSIEWTESSWNPITGCTKTSPGCTRCYAERMARRLQLMGQENYRNGFRLTLHERALETPLRWKRPQVVFVNSMSDLFHEEVPEEYICRIFDIMNAAYWHTFQILTKRAERLARLNRIIPWKSNIWMGVSVENSRFSKRIDMLRSTDAHVKFLSLEPLLGPMGNLNVDGIDWVIVGGESGPGARPMKPEWATRVRDQCLAAKRHPAGPPWFFFKQWGGANKKKAGRLLEGRTWDEMPPRVQPTMSREVAG